MQICVRCLKRQEAAVLQCPDDGSPLLELGEVADSRIGTVAAERFLVLNKLGSGGMGSVYRAQQLSLEKQIALKVLVASSANDPGLAERFDLEAKMLARLRSPHTVAVYDFGHLASGELYIAMELLFGRSLESVIVKEAPLSPARVCRLVDQICLSLEEAHAIPIVHRDIKPSNIMLESIGEHGEHVKVLDFGLVKPLGEISERSATLTGPGRFCGTPPYMAPELWSSEFGEVGPGADIYALGAMMFLMLTGRRPFNSKTQAGLMHQHLFEAPDSLGPFAVDDDRRSRLQKIIHRCLQKQPQDRYPSVSALRMELAALASSGPAPRPKSRVSLEPARRSFSREARVLGFALFAASTTGAGELFGGLVMDRHAPLRPEVRLQIESTPSEAEIFVDGAPTGLLTPAAIVGLSAQHEVKVTLSKPGFLPGQQIARPSADDPERLAFVLLPRGDRGE